MRPYTCPQVTLTLSPVPSIFPAAHNRWSYWVRPHSNCYVTMSSSPRVRPPHPPCCLLWLCSYLSCLWSTHRCGYLIHPWSTPPPPHPSTSCAYMATSLNPGECPPRLPFYQLWLHGYLTYPWRMPTMPVLLPAVATWFLTNPWSTHITPSQVWLCGFSPIPWVHPPHPPLCLCQLWLRGYLTNPWSTHTTPSQVWLCGYLLHPWSMPPTPISLPLPGVSTWLLTNPWSMHTTPSQVCLSRVSLEYAHHAHPLPAVAMWLSHLSLDHAHHARPSTSCGYVASHQSLEYAHNAQSGVPISPIPGVRPARPPSVAISLIPASCPPRPPFYQLRLRGFSPVPGVCTPRPARCAFLTYPWTMPTTPALLPAVAMWLCHQSLEYAQRTQPTARCGYAAISRIPRVRPPSVSGGYTAISAIPEVHPSYGQMRLEDFSPVPGIHPPRPTSPRCGGYVAISLFTSWDSAASFHTTGVPLHTEPFRQLWLPYPPSPALS